MSRYLYIYEGKNLIEKKENKKKVRFKKKQANTLTTKKKVRNHDLDHAIDQEK